MTTSGKPPGPDLRSLRIEDRLRNPGGWGRRLGLFAAAVGATVLIAGVVFALRGRTATVEVGVARGTQCKCARLKGSSIRALAVIRSAHDAKSDYLLTVHGCSA